MTKRTTTEKQEAIEQLREWIKPGDTIYTILETVSRSGMSRVVRVLLPLRTEGETPGIPAKIDFIHPNYSVSKACGYRLKTGSRDGLVIGGCGFDAGFEVAYSIARALWPDGFSCIGEGCPSNDHSNGDRNYTPGHCVHSDGGYALRHRWL